MQQDGQYASPSNRSLCGVEHIVLPPSFFFRLPLVLLIRPENTSSRHPGEGDRRECRARDTGSRSGAALDTGLRRHDGNLILHRAGALKCRLSAAISRLDLLTCNCSDLSEQAGNSNQRAQAFRERETLSASARWFLLRKGKPELTSCHPLPRPEWHHPLFQSAARPSPPSCRLPCRRVLPGLPAFGNRQAKQEKYL